MTVNQIIKKLQKAGIDLSNLKIERDSVEVCVDYREIDNNVHKYGDCNETKTRRLANKVSKILGWKSGFPTAYGAQILTAYAVKLDTGNCL